MSPVTQAPVVPLDPQDLEACLESPARTVTVVMTVPLDPPVLLVPRVLVVSQACLAFQE